ncbi:MAG TPA: nuclear transport factor 2 family protein [Acidimicrobiales bacterium]|nr:nuclear transport factor 2 family protein [Acidimicrobiales bacterium]
MGTGAAEQEVRAVLEQMRVALKTGDTEALGSLLLDSPDAVHIGTDAREWWTTQDLVKAVTGHSDITTSVDHMGVHVLGDVAWAEARGHFTSPKGAECPVRVTSVLVRESGQWKVAQEHASIGVPNEEMFA